MTGQAFARHHKVLYIEQLSGHTRIMVSIIVHAKELE